MSRHRDEEYSASSVTDFDNNDNVNVNDNDNDNDNEIHVREIDYSLYILNEKNKYITKDFINKLLMRYKINYKIKDLALFQRALTHESYVMRDLKNDKIVKLIKEKSLEPIDQAYLPKTIPLQEESYERLEFLGDSLIHMVLADYLYNRYQDRDEGFLTKLRTKIENGQTLSNLARIMQLHEYVLLAKNIEDIGGRHSNDHIFEDTFESLLGALFKDSNKDYPMCERFIINVIEEHIDIAQLIYKETNYKDLLLQHHHKMKFPDPEYGQVGIIEKNNKKLFHMYVKGPTSAVAGDAIASSKRKAEQGAAQKALIKYGVLNEDSDDETEIYD